MKPSLVVLTAVVILLAAVGASHLQAAPAASQASTPFLPTPPVGAPQQLVVYAHIKSITAKGGSFEAKVDPAEYLSGETANRAAIADKVIQPGDTVPNDHYVRDESHQAARVQGSCERARHGDHDRPARDPDPGLRACADRRGQEPEAPEPLRSEESVLDPRRLRHGPGPGPAVLALADREGHRHRRLDLLSSRLDRHRRILRAER